MVLYPPIVVDSGTLHPFFPCYNLSTELSDLPGVGRAFYKCFSFWLNYQLSTKDYKLFYMTQAKYFSQEGLAKLKAELDEREHTLRQQIAERVASARDLGDLSENAEYNEAREDQAFNESRVEELKNILKNAVLVEGEAVNHSAVSVGSCVLTSSKFGEKEFTIVGTTEANPAAGFISNESPLGSAFLGKRPGDEIAIKTPNGEVKYKIVKIH